MIGYVDQMTDCGQIGGVTVLIPELAIHHWWEELLHNQTALSLKGRLLFRPGTVVTRGRLLRAVWGTGYSEESHYLHVYVSRLRRKLAEADPSGRATDLFVAEPGVGYRVRDDPPDDA